jgi:hypothetical protein
MNLENLPDSFKAVKKRLNAISFADIELSEEFKTAFENYISDNKAGGYAQVEWAQYSAKITTSTTKSIFLPNYWFYVASELSDYYEIIAQYKKVFTDIYTGQNVNSIATKLKTDVVDEENLKKIKSYFASNSFSDDEYKNFLQFISEYSSWGGGKTIDRDDYYISALMKAGNLLAETQGAIAEITNLLLDNSLVRGILKTSLQQPIHKPQRQNNVLRSISSSNATLLPKPFILLAGISGTGKTRFVREQAIAHNVGDVNFCQIPVRPDWHEPSDLLGYVSRISGTKYIATKALKFIIDAWRVVAPNADKEGMGDLDLSVAPYWLCLDEMNLAPVEQYFADYLSVLESRKFENGKYTCEPLLTQSNFQMDIKSLRTDLGISDDEDGLWEYFSHHGIPLPPNIIVAGTVNMDETTHGFSRKVIDRACTLDFGEFFPNDYQKFFSGQELPKTFTYSQLTHASQKDLINTFDVDGAKTVAFLESINKVLKQTPFELAYRALNELLLHVACFSPQNEKELQAVWDDFLMTKVLPRIDGDDDKLRLVHKGEPANLLEVLVVLLESNLNEIWAEGKTKKDFFRNTQDEIPCRSRTKIEWMKNRLEANTFTSFWP